jgi:PKD repeat protein
MDNCFDPLNRIIQEIDSKFTINASIAANPRQGSAPLTVTLDARASTDPSNATIPSNNFFRYFKDTSGIDRVIGRGPVVNYTFDKEGNYIINLTVRSANQSSEGIFDGSSKISIDVAPQAANIVIYAAGQRMREDQPTKIGSQEARRGIMLDASATQAKGGRKILSHKREITGDKGFKFQQAGQTPPGAIRTVFPDDGAYAVTLTVKDNENNELKKTYRLLVSDPIAVVKFQPANGTTATMFNFDASASYSVSSSIRNYKRDVFDTEGEKLETLQTKSFKRDFKKPGTYKIVLTVSDQLGNANTETLDLFVDSATPIAQFTYEPVLERSLPSQFILDAGATSDEDVINGNDQLTYERKFSNTENVIRERTEDNGKRIVVSFNQKGEYLVQLNVRDSFGKVSSIEKKIKVDSGLRPVMGINPVATSR